MCMVFVVVTLLISRRNVLFHHFKRIHISYDYIPIFVVIILMTLVPFLITSTLTDNHNYKYIPFHSYIDDRTLKLTTYYMLIFQYKYEKPAFRGHFIIFISDNALYGEQLHSFHCIGSILMKAPFKSCHP